MHNGSLVGETPVHHRYKDPRRPAALLPECKKGRVPRSRPGRYTVRTGTLSPLTVARPTLNSNRGKQLLTRVRTVSLIDSFVTVDRSLAPTHLDARIPLKRAAVQWSLVTRALQLR